MRGAGFCVACSATPSRFSTQYLACCVAAAGISPSRVSQTKLDKARVIDIGLSRRARILTRYATHERSTQGGRLDGKVAFLTGGGAGIAKATAQAHVREGAKVALAEIDREAGEQAQREIGD